MAVPSGWSMWALLHQWDAQHFEAVARAGYTDDTYAFFPGFPLLLRALGVVVPLDVAGSLSRSPPGSCSRTASTGSRET